MYRDAVAAADPGRVTASLLARTSVPKAARNCWICAVGKAAHGMAVGAHHWLSANGYEAQGIVIGVEPPSNPLANARYLVGDHPVPRGRSFDAAEQLESFVRGVAKDDYVLVLISGGTSSLIGAPVTGVDRATYQHTFETLLGSGLDIEGMNAERRRISRWADGRLAQALGHATVQPVIMSDVVSDDPATVGSGPCTPRGKSLPNVATPLIAAHDLPVRGALQAAAAQGLHAEPGPALAGDAAECGRALVTFAVSTTPVQPHPMLFVSGGETTVTLRNSSGRGGRCQELALAAAERLAEVHARQVGMLVAGTDGRDGPTDAAGAFVDVATWQEIRNGGRDPSSDLAAHNSYAALDAAGALLRTGPTGTNMLDLALVMIEPA